MTARDTSVASDGSEDFDISSPQKRLDAIAKMIRAHREDRPSCNTPLDCVLSMVQAKSLADTLSEDRRGNSVIAREMINVVSSSVYAGSPIDIYMLQLIGDIANVIGEVSSGKYVSEEIYLALKND